MRYMNLAGAGARAGLPWPGAARDTPCDHQPRIFMTLYSWYWAVFRATRNRTHMFACLCRKSKIRGDLDCDPGSNSEPAEQFRRRARRTRAAADGYLLGCALQLTTKDGSRIT